MTEEVSNEIKYNLDFIFSRLNIAYDISIHNEGNQFRINIACENSAMFTDQNLGLLFSLQHILRTLVHKKFKDDKTHFVLDINEIRKNKETRLNKKLPEIVKLEVIDQGKSLVVLGLNSFERLMIRKLLEDVKEIEIMSVGANTERKLLILPSSEFGSVGLNEAVVVDSNSSF